MQPTKLQLRALRNKAFKRIVVSVARSVREGCQLVRHQQLDSAYLRFAAFEVKRSGLRSRGDGQVAKSASQNEVKTILAAARAKLAPLARRPEVLVALDRASRVLEGIGAQNCASGSRPSRTIPELVDVLKSLENDLSFFLDSSSPKTRENRALNAFIVDSLFVWVGCLGLSARDKCFTTFCLTCIEAFGIVSTDENGGLVDIDAVKKRIRRQRVAHENRFPICYREPGQPFRPMALPESYVAPFDEAEISGPEQRESSEF